MASALATSLLGGPISISPQALASTASINITPECRGSTGTSTRHSGLVLSSSVSHSSLRTSSHGGVTNSCCEHPRWGATSSGSGSGSLRLDSAAGRRLLVERKNGAVRRRVAGRIAAEGTDIVKVAGTILKLGRDGLDAATKLFPESVPKPLAQAVVVVAATAVLSWFLRSVFSTLAFVLAIGALGLAAFSVLTKTVSESVSDASENKGSKEGQGDSDSIVDSARKIMDKYK